MLIYQEPGNCISGWRVLDNILISSNPRICNVQDDSAEPGQAQSSGYRKHGVTVDIWFHRGFGDLVGRVHNV